MIFLPVILVLISGAIAAVVFNKLTHAGAVAGIMLGFVIFLGVGWIGISFMSVFFLLGTAATLWGRREKEKLGVAQGAKGRRNAGQVIANGGAGGLIGLAAFVFPQYVQLLIIMMAAAFSSATADTLSSELGTIYGRRFYNILSFKKGIKGRDGVISAEGFLFGIAGSVFIAMLYAMAFGWSLALFWIVIAGTIGNLTDSLLGATLERNKSIGNDTVNFLNTATAALFILLIY
ncbi:MAG TPA: DUF92 domain-containing protein [Chitinophagaceae bacterium]|nr:DUF92 domain-containing protein [Chitinophagaceae bacterium]